MKMFAMILGLALMVPALSHATDGKADECFKIAIEVPALDGNGNGKLISTGSTICTVEKNTNPLDPDGILSTADVTITFKNAYGKTVTRYELGAVSSDGALGTIYTSYGKTPGDLQNADPTQPSLNVVSFRMRNDHLKKGDRAGRVTLPDGSMLTLIQD
jgi:hypothetical protein